MDDRVAALFAARDVGGPAAYDALVALFEATEGPVPWAYQAWDRLIEDLESRENGRRSFAAQMLCRLAISDPERRVLAIAERIASIMRDPSFVVARHATQTLWRAGVPDRESRDRFAGLLADRFRDCSGEKNARFVRTDVAESLGKLARFDATGAVADLAERAIGEESDAGAQVKQRAAFRKGLRSTEACRTPSGAAD